MRLFRYPAGLHSHVGFLLTLEPKAVYCSLYKSKLMID